jgi:hypothetical protein
MKTVENSTIAFVATIFLVTGCSQTYAGKDGSSVTVSGDGTKIAVKGSDGSTVASTMNQDYPTTFPVPQYPGSKISTNMAINSAATGSTPAAGQTIIMLNTTDKPTQIVQFYKDKLSAAGWKIENAIDSPGSASFVGAVKDNSHLNVSIIGGPSDTAISLTLQ